MISHDVPLRARGFLMRGKGNVLRKCCFVTVQFLGILIIMMFSIYMYTSCKRITVLIFYYILVNAE